MLSHPCFHRAASRWFEHLHLAVAPSCNMKCHYCDRLTDCIHENSPHIASKVLTPRQARDKVIRAVKHNPRLRVVGIAGPGEPLANKETFAALALIHAENPELIKCVSTNGLLLADTIDELIKVGVSTLSVTINSVDPGVLARLIDWIAYKEHIYKGEEAAHLLIEKQLAGIREAIKRGLAVKINSVLIPSYNDYQIVDVAVTARKAGVQMMNIIPLVPRADFTLFPAPTEVEMQYARHDVARIIPLSPSCRKCNQNVAEVI